MSDRDDYKELLFLKTRLKQELKVGNYEKCQEIYNEFCKRYKEITGNDVEENLSREILQKIQLLQSKRDEKSDNDNKKRLKKEY